MMHHIEVIERSGNWITGVVSPKLYHFQAKVYDGNSMYGIDGGRVSKLLITDQKGNWVVNYDRDWDIVPKNDYEVEMVDSIVAYCEELPTDRGQ